MITIKTVISREMPAIQSGLWLKPVEGGFAAYLIDGGIVSTLKLVDDKGTEDTKDDVVHDIIGSVQDEKTENTINGAKAYARDLSKTIKGSPNDSSSELTLYGLRSMVKEAMSKREGHASKEKQKG